MLENNAKWCEKKGVNVLGTADFTHPVWFKEIEDQLEERERGLFRLKSGMYPGMRYMLTAEVSQIYKRGGKVRRIHNIILAPSLEAVRKINKWLDNNGANRKSDGRPILGFDSEELYKVFKSLDDNIVMIPAHAWTPWFSIFGSKSGFDSLEECYGEMTPYIYAVETGLSSDPLMNRQLKQLDKVMLISNSDAHSPRNFGREANVFEIEPEKFSYNEFIRILRERDAAAFKYTIEFFPQEGKYYLDGHASCGFSCEPDETNRLGGRCPKCGGVMTVGVLSRVNELADRPTMSFANDMVRLGMVPYKHIVPLQEIIAESLGVVSTSSVRVQAAYEKLITEVGNEFEILLDVPIARIVVVGGERVGRAIELMRAGKVQITPGFDGIFGQIKML
jgi:uncharacterized protein (TIGR00375 family)